MAVASLFHVFVPLSQFFYVFFLDRISVLAKVTHDFRSVYSWVSHSVVAEITLGLTALNIAQTIWKLSLVV